MNLGILKMLIGVFGKPWLEKRAVTPAAELAHLLPKYQARFDANHPNSGVTLTAQDIQAFEAETIDDLLSVAGL